MSREEQFMNFPKPHIIDLLCDMTDLFDESEKEIERLRINLDLVTGYGVGKYGTNRLQGIEFQKCSEIRKVFNLDSVLGASNE